MFQKLKSVLKHYEELTQKLSDPKIIGDNLLFQKLSRERASLLSLVEAYEKHAVVRKNIEGNQEILANENDEELRAMAKAELEPLLKQEQELTQKLKMLLLPPDPNDDRNILLEIRAGTGGEEAGLFVSDLFRMYTKYAESRGWIFELLESSPTGVGGFKEIVAQVRGEKVYSNLKFESGIHRVQRVPETEQQGRVHTSAVSVVVIPEPDEVEVKIEEKDLRVDTYSAGGPGGQHVNKTQSAVRLTHIPTGTVVTCQDEKSQHKNKARAMKILKARVYDKMLANQEAEQSATRRAMIKTGDRSEKIRTYNFPQNRLTDHRIGLTIYQLDTIIDGHLEEVIAPLQTHFQSEQLKETQNV